ncbi:ABC transporter permease [Anaerotruncus sp. AF02-27]|uniref:ABC transporter permease n=1 Tax=Anaerotruncus sp. AF02-27 TaxID=2292191 RepID=UPI000E529B2B|nr:ABC transporter permease [Anaerotruncus sp. AF02-27]RGX55897.1 ABC transporter permease [Anaerotruncus sp. AF02-27]
MNELNAQLDKWKKYKALLIRLVQRDLKVKYRRSVLGYLWSLLNPLLMMVVMSIVFSYMFRFDIPNYPIYLITGQIMFTFFSESTNMAMGSIIGNASLIKKVYVPKYIFPVSRVLSCFVTLLFSLVAVVIVMFATRTPVTPVILLFPLPLCYVLLFSMGIGLILSVCAVYFRDTTHLYGVCTTAWMYLTPIFYPIASIPETVQPLIRLNPLFQFIDCFREIVLYGRLPTVQNTLASCFWCAAALLVGMWLFKRKQANFILHI